MNKNIITTIVLLIIVGTGAFFGGMQYQKTKTRSAFGQFGGQMMGSGQGFKRFGGQNGSAIRGEIISVSDTSITVAQRDGSSKIILLSGSTNISKAAAGSKSDLIKGTQVMAVGTTNSDGSVTAQLIQLNPMMPQGSSKSAAPTQ
ncbi:MAG TPA: hypothetical protein VLF89_02455 [Candidatus Saccharimonadales bacterium]|nr:hypothetical protein [Candidatus Saccharimonadales bacterium]